MLFSQIYGLEEIKKKFVHAIDTEHIAHAQMFYGRQGSANLSLALAYAQYLNCENRSVEPKDSCGQCASCVKMQKLVHPDLHLVMPVYSFKAGKDSDAQRNDVLNKFRTAVVQNPILSYPDWVVALEAGTKQCKINVNEGRNIIRNLSLKSFESKYKIVLIWLPEHMNIECANAILKVLEEPPKKTVFLMVTNDVEKNITTIISRSQIAKIPSYSKEDIQAILTQEHQEVDAGRIEKASIFSEGDLNKAQTLLSELNDAYHVLYRDWMRSCFKRDTQALVRFSDDYQKLSKQDQKGFLEYGIHVLRGLLFIHNSSEDLVHTPEEELSFLQGFSKAVPEQTLEPLYGLLNDAIYHLERNANPKILSMDLSLKILQVFSR